MRSPVLLISMIIFGSLILGLVTAAEEPHAWMEPEHPTEKDHISIYCKAPGAYDVRFNVCNDDTGLCYMLMNQTKVDSETWKVDVYGTLEAGTKAHYEVTVIYQNESTGNESEVHLGPVHFTVESAPQIKEDDSTPSIGLIAGISAMSISALLWRKVRRD